MNTPEERLEGDHWAIVGCAARTSDGCNAGDGRLELLHSLPHTSQQVFIKAYSLAAAPSCGTILLVPSTITPWKVSLEVPLGAPSFLVAGMTPRTIPRTSIFFFSFATVKSVDIHCRLWLPGNPVHLIFHNTAYHDIHHQLELVQLLTALLCNVVRTPWNKYSFCSSEESWWWVWRPYVKLEATTMKTEYNSFPLLMYSPNSRGKYAFSHHQDLSSMNHLWGGHIEYS